MTTTSAIRAKLALLQAVAATQAALAVDPLDATCHGPAFDAQGNVTALNILHIKLPGAQYQLYRAHVRGTVECQGNAVVIGEVVDENGIAENTSAIKMLWAWPAFDADGSPAGDGNGKGEFAIASKFPENTPGPLGFGVYSPTGALISDVCSGWGQLSGRPHVGGHIVFQRVGTVTPPGPGPDPDPAPVGNEMARIAVALESLAKRLGM